MESFIHSRVTLYTAGHLHTAVPHCTHSHVPIVHTAVPRENNEHGCVYLRCRAVCKLPGGVGGHPWHLYPPDTNRRFLVSELHNYILVQTRTSYWNGGTFGYIYIYIYIWIDDFPGYNLVSLLLYKEYQAVVWRIIQQSVIIFRNIYKERFVFM